MKKTLKVGVSKKIIREPKMPDSFKKGLTPEESALHQRIAELEKALIACDKTSQETQAIAKIGSWETNLKDLKVAWSPETYRIFEVPTDEFTTSHPNFLDLVHPDDRAKVDAAFFGSLANNAGNEMEHRIVTPAGEVKTVVERWKVFFNDQGRPLRVVGTCQDITEYRRSQDALLHSKQLLEDKHAALREVLNHLEAEKQQIRDQISDNIEKHAIPLIVKIRLAADTAGIARFKKYTTLLENNLRELLGVSGTSLTTQLKGLSAREIEICRFIRDGLTNKDIASVLNVALATIETHRVNIRRKLGIKQDVSLASYLKNS